MLGIARGIHFAHTLQTADGSPCGLIHCDIKPANIFMFPGDVPKIGDWGLARSEYYVDNYRKVRPASCATTTYIVVAAQASPYLPLNASIYNPIVVHS